MARSNPRGDYSRNHINSDNDIINVIDLDEEVLPDADEFDDEDQSRLEDFDATFTSEIDDSIHCFLGHQGPVHSVACSPISNSRQVATGGEDDLVYLWQVGDGDVYHKLQGHTDSVTSLEFSKDGRLLASGGMDGVVNIWESSSATLKQKLQGPSGTIEWLQWHPQGHLLLAGSDDFSSWLWDPDTGSCMQVLLGHNGMVTCGSFTPDGELICTGSDDGSLRIWKNSRSSGSNSIHVVQPGYQFHFEVLTCVSISNDSRLAITGSADTKACLVNIQSGIPVATLTGHLDSIQCATFLSGAIPNLAATCGLDGRLIVWDVQTSTIRSICEHEHEVLQLQWCPTLQLICLGSSDGKVQLWDYRTERCERVLQGHCDKIQGLALSSDGSIIVSGSDDHSARAFEVLVQSFVRIGWCITTSKAGTWVKTTSRCPRTMRIRMNLASRKKTTWFGTNLANGMAVAIKIRHNKTTDYDDTDNMSKQTEFGLEGMLTGRFNFPLCSLRMQPQHEILQRCGSFQVGF